MLVGYARVSTREQDPTLQLNALQAVGCEHLFVEQASGAQRDRPELNLPGGRGVLAEGAV